jgi:hypothetical protein
MISHSWTGEDLLQYIRGILEPVRNMRELFSIPHVFVPESSVYTNIEKRPYVEDAVLTWFQVAGFDGDRSRNHFYGDPRFSGYHGLLQKLADLPQLKDYLMKRYAIQDDNAFMRFLLSMLNKKFPEAMCEALHANTLAEHLIRHNMQDSDRLLHLARAIQPASFPQVLESIIDTIHDDECGDIDHLSSGAPDLLLWTKAPLPPFWFFAEVKGPKDSIRDSQIGWIRANWERIEGRVLIIAISTTD